MTQKNKIPKKNLQNSEKNLPKILNYNCISYKIQIFYKLCLFIL